MRALAVSPDKKTLYAGGYFGAVNGTKVSSLAAIDIATCKPKTSFRPAFAATVRALTVTKDTVYAGVTSAPSAGRSASASPRSRRPTGRCCPSRPTRTSRAVPSC